MSIFGKSARLRRLIKVILICFRDSKQIGLRIGTLATFDKFQKHDGLQCVLIAVKLEKEIRKSL